ncbi:MAG: serine protease [Gordonia sp. (in: high G+C Gram-positive bacteria)]|uniref:serine protease n=1 Tax=Gordonia sp. (in: high G+C Gram-positive bacteria) TaxID=84139 RepID=UPI003BB55C6F
MKKMAVVLAAIVATILSLTVGVGSAQAAPPKTAIGGGSGILVLKGGNSAAACTVTAVGRPTSGPNQGQLIALTAGHCGRPGQSVLAESAQNRGVIGVFQQSWTDIDVGVIKLDSTRVRPVRTVGGVTIKRLNTTPITFPTIICKEGRTTGHTCGITWFSDSQAHFSQMCVIEGDSGSPVVVGDTLVGMVNAYYFVSCLGPETGTNMGTIIRRLNATGYNGFKVV